MLPHANVSGERLFWASNFLKWAGARAPKLTRRRSRQGVKRGPPVGTGAPPKVNSFSATTNSLGNSGSRNALNGSSLRDLFYSFPNSPN